MSAALPAAQLTAQPLDTVLPAANNGTVVGYTPSQIRTAYGFGSSFKFGSTNADGSGQTIAIVDAYNDPDISSDLKTFDGKFGLSNPSLTVVGQNGGAPTSATNGSWGQEVSLDVEWAHAIAPGAKILLVETNSANFTDLLAGVNYARYVKGVSVVSMSWGVDEFSGETAYDNDFGAPSGYSGETFVAAAGDAGSDGGVLYPAANPHVLGVGGTSLTTSGSTGTYSSEAGWADSSGGLSKYEAEPSYQRTAQDTGSRSVPDVSYDANPNTGVAVYDSFSYQGDSGWLKIGGTSAAAPQWAGLVAIGNQGRAIYGNYAPLYGTGNTLPALYAAYKSGYSTAFHDVSGGSSTGKYTATGGYDEVTGLGSPKATGIVTLFVNDRQYVSLSQSGNAGSAAIVAAPAAAVAADQLDPTVAVPSAPLADAAGWAAATPAAPADLTVTAVPAPASIVAALAATAAPAVTFAGGTIAPAAGTMVGTATWAAPAADGVAVAASLGSVAADAVAVAPASVVLSLGGTTLPPTVTAVAPTAVSAAAAAMTSRPVAAVLAGTVVAAAWLATESARDRRRETAATASPFADTLISFGSARRA